MKYIDADKLIAEIERLGRNWDGVQELQPASLFQADLYELLSIIASLQQEQPEMDLEKELDSLIIPELKKYKALPSLMDVAKHFYELGKNARKED